MGRTLIPHDLEIVWVGWQGWRWKRRSGRGLSSRESLDRGVTVEWWYRFTGWGPIEVRRYERRRGDSAARGAWVPR